MTRDLAGLRKVHGVLFDMDGVIYIGNQRLPGVREMIDYLESTERRYLFVTNNPVMSPEQFVERLSEMGVDVRSDQILGSAEATACWLAEQIRCHGWPRGPAIVIGEDGLNAALQDNGFELTKDPHAAAYAVVGISFQLNYEDLVGVTLAIRGGAKFIATNSEAAYPSDRGPLPGTGSILALLASVVDQQPVVIGKPNRSMYEQAMSRLNLTAGQTLVVGDRYETDIAGAISLGLWTAGVLTGASIRDDFEHAGSPPDLISEDLLDLVDRFCWAEARQLGQGDVMDSVD